MKLKIGSLLTTFLLVANATAATLVVSNVSSGPGDTLFADSSNALLSGGIVAIGIFPVGFDVAGNANLASVSNLVTNFTVLTSAITGSPAPSFAGSPSVPGYVEGGQFTGPVFSDILGSNATYVSPVPQIMYGFVGNRSDLGSSTQFALFEIRTISDDSPFVQRYQSNPAGKTLLLGSFDTFTGNPDPNLTSEPGAGTYPTLKLAAVPEPTTFLLSSIGMLALLRRRR